MSEQRVSGVLYVHSATSALCPHIEWAVGRVLGHQVNFNWIDQPAIPGFVRTEYHWVSGVETATAMASELRGWEHLRYEVCQDPAVGVEGGRWMHTPDLGIFYGQTDSAGNLLINEQRIRTAIEEAGSNALELHRELRLILGQAWDDELEVFRQAGENNPVVWLHPIHQVG